MKENELASLRQHFKQCAGITDRFVASRAMQPHAMSVSPIVISEMIITDHTNCDMLDQLSKGLSEPIPCR